MPIASLTALGSSSGDMASAVAAIVDYLEGRQSITASIDAPPLDEHNLVGYYADTKTSDSVGWWSGRGINGTQITGAVEPDVLAQVLLGRHPDTGEQLVGASGSAGRAALERDQFPQTSGLEPLASRSSDAVSVADAARQLGVSERRVQALAASGTERRRLLAAGEDVDHIRQWLDGRKEGRQWFFDPSEIERASEARTAPRVVVAYDFTLSVEKSISLAWVHAGAEQRAVIEDALRHGVQAGVSHLEDHGLAVRRDRSAVAADGLWAASYLHLTNRNLEPQLHVHTVIVNVAADAATGETQTVDGRGLFREVTTAGYLAGAEIRAQLAERLGAAWDRPHKGTMELAGVPETAIAATSTRRAEVMALADELGYTTAKSRQIAALSTRAPKQHPENFDDLVASWRTLLAEHGFGPDQAATILQPHAGQSPAHEPQPKDAATENLDQQRDAATELATRTHDAATDVVPVSIHAATDAATGQRSAATGYRGYVDLPGAPERIGGLDATQSADLFVWLGSPAGLTRSSGVFSRSDIVQAVVTWDAEHGGGARLHADTIQDVADRVLAGAGIGSRFDDHVLPITVPDRLAQRSAGRPWLTTESMLAIETDVIDAYRNGHGAVVGIDPGHATESITRWQTATGNRLGSDQAAMIATVTTGTDRFALVVGPAGTGKTSALEVACRAWEDAGLTPQGLAVTGSAADTLAASTGIETSTVASILARDSAGLGSGFTANTVVVVDEASMLSNRDHLRLVQLVQVADARMVAIGDPAQHGAVEAGGLWAHLVEVSGASVATLEVNRRQSATHMTDVRLANDAIRRGEIKAAFQRLTDDQRIVTAPTSAELLDRLAADWYVDHLTHRTDPATKPSSMMAENHSVRRELTIRAQTLLRADGTLTGDPLRIGEATFHVGDRVITRTQHDTFRFDDRTKLRNGTTGTVTDIHPAHDGRHELTVTFDHKAPVRLDHHYLTTEVRPGLHGAMVPAYAVTTHVAQGQTMAAGRTVGTDASSREAIYVGLSRGTDDARVYVVDRAALSTREAPDVGLPVIDDARPTTERLVASLARTPVSEVATAIDPTAPHVGAATRRSLTELHAAAPTDPVAATALDISARRLARNALLNPPAKLIELAGPRPPATNPNRPQWDRATTATITYWATHLPDRPFASVLDPSSASHDPTAYLHARSQLNAATRNHAATLPTTDLAARAATDSAAARVAATALDKRAATAAKNPADYITALLGPTPPAGTADASRHQRTTETIEKWRHHQGLEPTNEWPAATTARQRAIGPKPHDPTLAKRWTTISNTIDRTIQQHETKPVHRPPAPPRPTAPEPPKPTPPALTPDQQPPRRIR